MTLEVTVGICAYNEEKIIGQSIESIFKQKLEGISVKEIIVVSSGSTDGTDDIVRFYQAEHPELVLIRQEKREGKNSAINCYLDAKSCDVVVMLNADNVMANEDTLQHLVEPFFNEKMGMVGGHPVPTNDRTDKVGFATHTLWSMHHNVALIHPKIGELVAFRDIGTRLTVDQQSDEDLIRMNLEKEGFECAYAPEAIVLNRGPETEEDFLKQRIRVNIGECVMKQKHNYSIPSWDKKILMKAAVSTVRDMGFHPFKLLYAMRLEMKSRRIAQRHVADGKHDMNIWDPVASTKKL